MLSDIQHDYNIYCAVSLSIITEGGVFICWRKFSTNYTLASADVHVRKYIVSFSKTKKEKKVGSYSILACRNSD